MKILKAKEIDILRKRGYNLIFIDPENAQILKFGTPILEIHFSWRTDKKVEETDGGILMSRNEYVYFNQLVAININDKGLSIIFEDLNKGMRIAREDKFPGSWKW